MTKELDLLLKSIEEAGGFRDACTRSLQSSIEEVEQSMDSLSKQCKIRTVMFLLLFDTVISLTC
jgi:nuclear pore complex protein Nup214